MLVAFADTIAGHSLVPHGKVCVTQGSTVNFLRPAAGAYLFCRATPVKVGSRICVVSVGAAATTGTSSSPPPWFTFAVVRTIDPVTLPPKHPNLTF